MTITLLLLSGLAALYFGAEWLVRGGASFAMRIGLTPLMVGLIVVAYGATMPELIVGATAAAGHAGLLHGAAVHRVDRVPAAALGGRVALDHLRRVPLASVADRLICR